MSNTGYRNANGIDLINIFEAYTSGTKTTTNYLSNGNDLCNIFQPYTAGRTQANLTGFSVNGNDLNTKFAVKPFSVSGNAFTSSTYINGYYVIKFEGGGGTTATIRFNRSIPSPSIICVGGGGGGASGSTVLISGGGIQTFRGCGGGGPAACQITSGYALQADTTYSITLGTGGVGGIGASGTVRSGSSGGTTSVSVSGNWILRCGGGGGGTSSSVGAGGTILNIAAGATTVGGSGGNGGTKGAAGNSSAWGTFTIPAEVSTAGLLPSAGGGGGAGAIYIGSGALGGGGGINRTGGTFNGGSAGGLGGNGVGGGGGGAAGIRGDINFTSNGGAGSTGIVQIFFPWTL